VDHDERRRLSIAKEWVTWNDALSRVVTRIDEVLKLPYVTETQATVIESIAKTVGTVFLGIREAVDSEDYDRLGASIDRLREELAAADPILDRFIKQQH
jgi:hypothetical protein